MAKAENNIITISNLNVYYKHKHILKNITCQIPKNKITAIIGQSGCGKSTFLKTLNRIIEEEEGRFTGEICINGNNILELPKEILRKQMGMLSQTPVVFPFSVKKNMLYPLEYHYKLKDSEKTEKIIHYLKLAGLYEEVKGDLNMYAPKLSGGQKQRLSIARCLCIEPNILMLDEPCSSLDIRNTMLIESLLHELKQSISIIVVTHDLAQAKRIADFVVFIEDGKLVEVGDSSIFSSPQKELTKDYMRYVDC